MNVIRAPVQIRAEQEADRETVLAVTRAAFGGDAEAELIAQLYADGDVLFGLVAETGGSIAGHVLFTRLVIETDAGEFRAAALAPLAVLPEAQRRGIGTALVQEGLARCRTNGLAAVVVLGDPAYYNRFGFRAETASKLRAPWSGSYLMAIDLREETSIVIAGIARYAPAFVTIDR